MGKITSIYLTDEEAAELKKFCEENRCTQYSAFKAALRELISKPFNETEESSSTIEGVETPQRGLEEDEVTERIKPRKGSWLQEVLKRLNEKS